MIFLLSFIALCCTHISYGFVLTRSLPNANSIRTSQLHIGIESKGSVNTPLRMWQDDSTIISTRINERISEFVVPEAGMQSNIDSKDAEDKKWVARGLLMAVAAFYGTNFGCVKVLDEALAPSMAASLRFTLAGVVFLPYLLKMKKEQMNVVLGGAEVRGRGGVHASDGRRCHPSIRGGI